jgi:hypothetical protein
MMIVVALVNFGLCFKSLHWLAFRTWEAVTAVEHPASIGPFDPGSMIVKEHAYGDLASIGNLKDMREYRWEEFTVDQFGFRNSHTEQQSNPVGFVVGDSFTAGAAVLDSETLPVQLSKDANGYFYNAGGGGNSFASAQAVSSAFRFTSGTLVYQLLERSARAAPPPMPQITTDYKPEPVHPRSIKERIKLALPASQISVLKAAKALVTRAVALFFSDHSPEIILSRKLVKGAEDDIWLPNPYSKDVVRRRLQNGEEILFYADDLEPMGDIDQLSSAWLSYLIAFSARMAEHNMKMVVLLVPNKYTVYGPLTDAPQRDFAGAKLLDRMEKELRSSGIPAVNLTPLFQTSAAQGLPVLEYLYWRDDTHWNNYGIKLAADALSSEIRNGRTQNAQMSNKYTAPPVAAGLSHSKIYRKLKPLKHN